MKLLFATVLLVAMPALAQTPEFLDPATAFVVTATEQDAKTLRIEYAIAKDYYLYQEKFQFAATQAQLASALLPAASNKFDSFFNKDVKIYRDSVHILLPVNQAPTDFELNVTSQGCADAGLCYPPQTQKLRVSLSGFGGDGTVKLLDQSAQDLFGRSNSSSNQALAITTNPSNAARLETGLFSTAQRALQGDVKTLFMSEQRIWMLLVFFLLGIALSLTPCVLPMVPIVANFVIGNNASSKRGLALTLMYCLGMSLVYTALGVIAASLGQSLGAWLQNPWLLGAFALMMVVLAWSQFGGWELQLPSRMRNQLQQSSSRIAAGSLFASALLGGISAIIVGPCVTAPLAATLLFISKTGDVVTGGLALFAMSWGMSVPLLLVGFFGPQILPKRGAWMQKIQRVFAWILLATALWILQPVLPNMAKFLGWALWLFCVAVELWGDKQRVLLRGVALLLICLGGALVVGALSGGSNLLRPFSALVSGSADSREIAFTSVNSKEELDTIIGASTQPVMLDFYADWCVSCKEMEAITFTNEAVQTELKNWKLLRADVTANSVQNQQLLKRFDLFGPPGIIFMQQGIETGRVIGFQNAEQFLRSLRRAKL